MEYVCYVVTARTKRLLDVEMYPVNPIGVSTDIRVVGEQYGRGMCGRALPDVGVLNKKKYYSLLGDSMTAQSPMVVSGPGLVRPIGDRLSPYQMVHARTGTTVSPLYDLNSLYKRNQALYEEDNLSVRQALRKDKMEMELADRMTATEFTFRQDLSQGVFAPMVGGIYKGIRPLLVATVQHAYMTGRLEQPPEEMFLSGLDFRIETHSTFSYGEGSNKAMNFSRAMAPLGDIPQFRPDILDNIDFNTVLRSSLAHFGNADFLFPLAKVAQQRQQRMQEQAMLKGGGGAGQVSAEQKGQNKAITERSARDAVSDGSAEQAQYMIG